MRILTGMRAQKLFAYWFHVRPGIAKRLLISRTTLQPIKQIISTFELACIFELSKHFCQPNQDFLACLLFA